MSISEYQQSGNAEKLIKQYHWFLMKYYHVMAFGQMDYSSYDLRKFICCYLKDQKWIQNLSRGKYHSHEVKKEAERICMMLHRCYQHEHLDRSDYPHDDLYHDLTIVFLKCASDYVEMQVGFEKYMYATFRYRWKRFCDQKLKETMPNASLRYWDEHEKIEQAPFASGEWADLFEETDLNHASWINGQMASFPFDQLSALQRMILVKFYITGYTDKELSKATGYHPVYINRMRNQLVRHFQWLRSKGDIKWIRS